VFPKTAEVNYSLEVRVASDLALMAIPLGRRLSLDSAALMSSPSIPSSHDSIRQDEFSHLGMEQKLNIILKTLEEQTHERVLLHARLKSMDEKLTTLLPDKPDSSSKQLIRRKMSMVSKRETNAKPDKPEKPETPRDSKKADFDDIDQKLGIKVMKAAKRRADQAGPLWHRSQSTGVIGHFGQDQPQSPSGKPNSPRMMRAFSRVSKTSKDCPRQGSRESKDLKDCPRQGSRESKDLESKGSLKSERGIGQAPGIQKSSSLTEIRTPPSAPPPDLQPELKPSGGLLCPVLPNATEEDEHHPKAATLQISIAGVAQLTASTASRAAGGSADQKSRKGHKSVNDISNLNSSGEVSLSHLFRHRETELMKPNSPRTGPENSPEVDEDSIVELSEDMEALLRPVPASFLLRTWLCICDFGLRITGLLPLVQCRAAASTEMSGTVTVDEQEPSAALASKVYNSLLLSLLFLFLVLAGPGQFFCNGDLLEGDLCSTTSTATDLGIALGALLAVWSCGGMYSYFKSARLQLQMNELLALEVESSGFAHHWMVQKGRDSFLVFLVWLCALGSRVALSLRWERDSLAAVKLSLYAVASGCILSACYLQVSMWRGISLAIVAYAKTVLEGNVSCREARAKWREVISCMRQTSRMYQLTAASCGLTTVFVCFGALYDFNQRMALDALPSLVVGLCLPGALYVAASATAHCTRLPSLVSMLDGEEELEIEYINLALFLSLSESGFFMWDTRVTLAVLQKFLYFTMAIVGTIGFQLKVLTF